MIIVNGADGSRHEIVPPTGRPLMGELRKLKAGVIGLCNGNAACGTCHVYVDPAWVDRLPEPDEYELERLEEITSRTDRSRLSCQLDYGPDLDGLEITVAVNTFTKGARDAENNHELSN
ncbi:2Fe-2S iron-sulfur cluster-binding protein [Nocardia sp. Marseille-Q1738]